MTSYAINKINKARLIAEIAHAAKGQMRADGITPYIYHPSRVVDLLYQFLR